MKKNGHNKTSPSAKRSLRAQLGDHRWSILGMLLLASFVLGYLGLYLHFERTDNPQPWHNLLYLTFQIFPFNLPLMEDAFPWQLQIARFSGPLLLAYTAIAAGLSLFQDQVHRVRARRARGHVIICGLGTKGRLLAADLRAAAHKIVVIERDGSNPWIRECRRTGVIVCIADATSRQQLKDAGASRAKFIIAVCGDDDANAEIAVNARSIVSGQHRAGIGCAVHIANPGLAELLQETEIMGQRVDAIRLEFFNVFESGARYLIQRYSPFKGLADPTKVHLLVVGLGHMGECAVVEAVCEFRRLAGETGGRFTLTIVDAEATERWRILTRRFRSLATYCNVILKDCDVASSAFDECEFMRERSDHLAVSHAFVCTPDENRALAAGMRLSEASSDCTVVTCSDEDAGLGKLIQAEVRRIGRPPGLLTFSILDATCTSELLHAGRNEIMARAAHEEYRQQRSREGETPETNPSIVPWSDLPEALRESNRHQVEHISTKLAEFGYTIRTRRDWDAKLHEFTPEEVEQMAELEHERWVQERVNAGWRYAAQSHGKQHEKTSTDLVAWNALREEAKEKDREAVRGLPGFLEKVGYEIEKIE